MRWNILDRNMHILLSPDTRADASLPIYHDKQVITLQNNSAIGTYDFTVNQQDPDANYLQLGNYISFRDKYGKTRLYTLMSHDGDEYEQTWHAEDIGLDLINEVADKWKYNEPHSFAWYAENLLLYDSGWSIGINEISSLTRSLSFDGQSDSVLTRLGDLANQFDGAEIDFEVQMSGSAVTKQVINVYKKLGSDLTQQRFVDAVNLKALSTNGSINDLRTAMIGYGSTPDDAGENAEPITFADLTYDDGRYFTLKGDKTVCDRVAGQTWARAGAFDNSNKNALKGYIVGIYTYDTKDPNELLKRTITNLKTVNEPQIGYEADLLDLQADIGDTVQIAHRQYNPPIYLSARVQEVDNCYTEVGQDTGKLGNYQILESQIDPRITDMVNQVAAKSASYVWVRYADDDKGTNMSILPASKKYVAVVSVKGNATPSDDPADYAGYWLPLGQDGSQGTPGKAGIDGKTPYFHIAYADSADGNDGFYVGGGGTNLYTDTLNFNDPASWRGYGSWTKTTDTYKGLAVMQSRVDWSGLSQYIQVKKGDVLTYSAYAKYTSGAGTSTIYWAVNQGASLVKITDSWQRISSTSVAASDGYLRPRIERGARNSNVLQICGIKVETGGVATPWSPAPSEAHPIYMGTYTDFTEAGSTDPSKYTWAKLRGEQGLKGDTGKDGVAGKDGVGIKSTKVEYAGSTSGTTKPTSTWTSTVPSVAAGNFLWTKTTWSYTDGTSESGYSVAKMGEKGDQGPKGDPGNQGIPGMPGADGRTPYTHWAYSWSADGQDRFTTVYPGENLYLNSKMISDGYGLNGSVKVTVEPFDDTTNMWHIVAAQGSGGLIGMYLYGYANNKLPDTTDWAYSADVKGTGKPAKFGVEAGDNNPVVGTVGSEWSRISQSGRIDNSKVKTIVMYFDTNISPLDVYIKLPKLETGTLVTPYTPSPLDDPEGAYPKFIGTYTDYIADDSTDPSKYTWAKLRGEQGERGKQIFKSSYEDVPNSSTNYWSDLSPAPSVYNPPKIGDTVITPAGNIFQINAVTVGGGGGGGVFGVGNVLGNIKGPSGKDGLAGKDGVGIKSTQIMYAQSTSGTTAPTTGWTAQVPTLIKGQYLWTQTTWLYTDNTGESGYTVSYNAKDGNTGTNGVAGKDGVGIKSTTITYANSTSGTTAPTSGWTANPPATSAGQYLWTKTVWTYTDGTNETGYSVGKIGEKGDKGDKGDSGKGIASTIVNYQASSSGTSIPTGTWLASIPAVAANQYLWTRTTWSYTDNTSANGYSVGKMGANGAPGDKGDTGNGIKSVVAAYQNATSGTVIPTGSWLSTLPNTPQGQYLWTRNLTTFTNGGTSTSYSVAYSAKDGQKGDKGDPGSKDVPVITSGTSFPNTRKTGDMHWETDSSGKVIGYYKFNGSQWVVQKIDAKTIAAETFNGLTFNGVTFNGSSFNNAFDFTNENNDRFTGKTVIANGATKTYFTAPANNQSGYVYSQPNGFSSYLSGVNGDVATSSSTFLGFGLLDLTNNGVFGELTAADMEVSGPSSWSTTASGGEKYDISFKKQFRRVWVTGVLVLPIAKFGTAGNGYVTMFNISDTKMRPKKARYIVGSTINDSPSMGLLEVRPNGDVVAIGVPKAGRYTFEGVSYSAEAD